MTSPLNFWEKKHGTYATKGFVKRPNLFAEEIAGFITPEARVLELGCGQGADSLFFAGRGATVTACDFSRFALDQFAGDAAAAGVRQIELNLSEVPYPFGEDEFDVVYAHLSLHYFGTGPTRQIFADIARILRPGGRFLATFNSIRDPEAGEGEELGERVYRELAPGDRKRFFSVEELAGLLGDGFTDVSAAYGRGTSKNPDDEFVSVVAAAAPAQVVVLGEPGSEQAGRFGSKAATLAALRNAGFPVGEGAALASGTYLRHMRSILGDRPEGKSFKEWSAEVHAAILAVEVPDSLVAGLRRAAEDLERHGSALIVRSSAVGEDTAGNSFAGQLDSIADVSARGLADAVRKVWASAWGPRAADYRERRGLEAVDDLPVAVLVQPFIEPELAGVHFTTSPIPGAGDSIVEAVAGRGEGLVSGSVEPVRYWLAAGGAVVQVDGEQDGLLDPPVAELYETGRRLAELLGAPQDIEWVFRDGRLTIVQSRPITTIAADTAARAPVALRGRVLRVTAADQEELPAELAGRDKFKLRLVATAAGAAISRGWWVSLRAGEPEDGEDPAGLAARITAEVERFPQVSMVLQRPGRFHGEIVRRFSPADQLAENLSDVVARVGAELDDFDLIVTEIYQAEKSGISHIIGDKLVIEVAYGSYVPKGVVPTALYVAGADDVELKRAPVQDHGIFIESGRPVQRDVGRAATLTDGQIRGIGRITEIVSEAYPDVSVEFGILADGTPYLIDIIPDMSPVAVDDVRVMSTGRISGVARVADSEDYAAQSLDAHFHSERGAVASDLPPTVIIAPRPFLALEDHLSRHGAGNVGFVFEQGSLLGHLAIILREHGVPAIVVPDIRERLADGDVISIDTATEDLFRIESAAEVS
jgi:SAM-dependent methyltransferase/phosphohistidine swiveling domain-containing protein